MAVHPVYPVTMCGRIAQANPGLYPAQFHVAENLAADFTPTWNLKPTQQALIALDGDKDGIRRLAPARWSLVPSWAKDLKLKYPTFNARIETAGEKPTFRAAMARCRCVFPIDGYYEWQTEGKSKTPFYVHGDEPIGLAGLYSWWRAPDATEGERWVLTATVLTQDAPASMTWLHERAPVVLNPALLDRWLDGSIDGTTLTAELTAGSTSLYQQLIWHEVGPVHGDGPELIDAAPHRFDS